MKSISEINGETLTKNQMQNLQGGGVLSWLFKKKEATACGTCGIEGAGSGACNRNSAMGECMCSHHNSSTGQTITEFC